MIPAVGPGDLVYLPQLVSACQAQAGDLTLVYALGIHPYALETHAEAEDRAHLDALSTAVERSEDARLRAIGECGLHFAGRNGQEPVSRARQLAVTRRQLELSRRSGLPAIMHCVRAHGPLLELLDEAPTPPGVVHSFTGGASLANEYTRRGHYVSFSASIMLPNARNIIEAARVVPETQILVETDSPDQTPPSLRPATNEPSNVRLVAQTLATVRGTDLASIARTTFDNACRVYGVEAQTP